MSMEHLGSLPCSSYFIFSYNTKRTCTHTPTHIHNGASSIHTHAHTQIQRQPPLSNTIVDTCECDPLPTNCRPCMHACTINSHGDIADIIHEYVCFEWKWTTVPIASRPALVRVSDEGLRGGSGGTRGGQWGGKCPPS